MEYKKEHIHREICLYISNRHLMNETNNVKDIEQTFMQSKEQTKEQHILIKRKGGIETVKKILSQILTYATDQVINTTKHKCT